MRFLRVSGRRLALLVPQMLVISLMTFALMRVLPGDPALQLVGPAASNDAIEAIRHRLGLDDPFWTQYGHYLRNAIQGDLGTSIVTGGTVMSDLLKRTPATLELITTTLILVILLAIPLGVYLARPGRTWIGRSLTRLTNGYGLLAGALPDFWLALVLVYFFFFKFGIAAAPLGRIDPAVTAPDSVTGFLVFDSLTQGNWAALRSSLAHLVLPVVTLVFVYSPVVMKMARTTVAETLDAPYVRFAHALGIPRRRLLTGTALNTVAPVVTILAVVYGYLLGGAVLVETVFSWGGVGQYAAQAVIRADFQAIQGFVLVAVVFNLVVYLVADLIQAMADPRIRL